MRVWRLSPTHYKILDLGDAGCVTFWPPPERLLIRTQLVTVKKMTSKKFPVPSFDADSNEASHVPAHKGFRDKFFQGFKKESEVTGDQS